ncbi:MAG TPA: sigma-70 family RNA polymerase sigma factor [Chitinophagaceae bacterium]|nr:sigma-70 family RNA polymerase sigma factor [Chitinophagaceae bacterium]
MQAVKQFETIGEPELIQKIKDGETGLFEILIRRNNPFLYKVGMSYGYRHEDVEDLMQESFICAFLNLEKFEQRSSFKTWVVRIMLNQCYRKAQKLSFKNEKTVNAEADEKQIPLFQNQPSMDTYKAVINRELSHVIGEAITRMPIDYRMVFSLRELNGMSTAETAEVLEISEANVKVRLNRARHMLRDMVEKMYSPEEIFEFNLVYCDRIVNRVMKLIP